MRWGAVGARARGRGRRVSCASVLSTRVGSGNIYASPWEWGQGKRGGGTLPSGVGVRAVAAFITTIDSSNAHIASWVLDADARRFLNDRMCARSARADHAGAHGEALHARHCTRAGEPTTHS